MLDSLHFVDPATGVHSLNVESYWAKAKRKIKHMKGYHASEDAAHPTWTSSCGRSNLAESTEPTSETPAGIILQHSTQFNYWL